MRPTKPVAGARMNRPTVYCVNISPKFKPVTVLPSSLAADHVTVDATFTEDAGGHTPAADTLRVCGRVGTAVCLDVETAAERIGQGNL